MFDEKQESIQYEEKTGKTTVGFNGKMIGIGNYKSRAEGYKAAREYLAKKKAAQ